MFFSRRTRAKKLHSLEWWKKFRFNFRPSLKTVLIALTSLALVFIFYSPYFKVSEIVYERDDFSIDPTPIADKLAVVKGANLIFLNLDKLKSNLWSNESTYKLVQLEKRYPDKVILKLESHEKLFIINSFYLEKNKNNEVISRINQQFYMTRAWELKPFIEQPFAWTWVDITYFTLNIAEETEKLEEWKIYLESTTINSIKLVLDTLNESYWLIPLWADFYPRWREIRIQTAMWKFWITLNRDLGMQLNKINILKKNFPQEATFGYIDLRVKNRLVYTDK